MNYYVKVRSVTTIVIIGLLSSQLVAQRATISTTRVGQLEAEYRNATNDIQKAVILDELRKTGFGHIADQLQGSKKVETKAVPVTAPLPKTSKVIVQQEEIVENPVKAIMHVPEEPQKLQVQAERSPEIDRLELELDKVLRLASTVWNNEEATLESVDDVIKQLRSMSTKLEKESEVVKKFLGTKPYALTQKGNMFELKRTVTIQKNSFKKQLEQIETDIAKIKDISEAQAIMKALDQLVQRIDSSSLSGHNKDILHKRIDHSFERLEKVQAQQFLKEAVPAQQLRAEADAVGRQAIDLLLQENPLLQDIDKVIEASNNLFEKIEKTDNKDFFKEDVKVLLERKALLEKKGAQQVQKLKK